MNKLKPYLTIAVVVLVVRAVVMRVPMLRKTVMNQAA